MVSMDLNSIGERVRYAQNQLGYSNEQMADILDVSTDHYRRMCRNNSFTSTQIEILGVKLNISADFLIHGNKAYSMFLDASNGVSNCSLISEDDLLKYLEENSENSIIDRICYGITNIEFGLEFFKNIWEELSTK